jgi:hypothetical protein
MWVRRFESRLVIVVLEMWVSGHWSASKNPGSGKKIVCVYMIIPAFRRRSQHYLCGNGTETCMRM